MSSGPREERAQGRGSPGGTGGPKAAEPATDWYVDDTYARDPHTGDAFGSAAEHDPYGLAAAEAAALPPQPGPQPPETQPAVLGAPVPHWAGTPVLTAAEPPAPHGEDEPAGEPETSGAGTDAEAEADTDAEAEAKAEAEAEAEAADYLGVDALLSGDHSAPEPQPFVPTIEFDPPLTAEEASLHEALAEGTGPQAPPAAGPPRAPGPPTAPPPAAPPAPSAGQAAGRVAGLVNSSAVMAAGTLVSRGTGFLRTMVIAAAIGVGTMGDSYNAANTLPTLLYILIGGGALNAVFVPQLVRSMKNDEDGGTAYANRLLTLVVCGLAGVAAVAVVAAPLLVQLISHSLMRDPASAETTVALARYCLPTMFFMGVHVVMGQILNARGRFGAMMWTPVLNNLVVIFTFGAYIWVYGTFQHSQVTPQTIAPEGVRLLGIGTLLGLAVQALSMIPYLRAAGFSFRPRFDWRGHGLGKAARLAKWTFLFVLANQAGFLVVTQLATAAGAAAEEDGHLGVGLAAYSNALLIWQLPMAVVTVSVMSAVLPRLSRAAADHDAGAVRDDLSYGLRTSAVAIVPAAFLFLSLGPVIGYAVYGLGNGGSAAHGALSIGYMLSAFALGLIPYSVQYVLLRGFYAYEDTRTPFSNTVWVAACQAATAVLCWLVLPAQWAVTGMALCYGASYAVGVAVAVPRLKARVGGLDTGRIGRTYVRLAIASLPAAAFGLAVELVMLDLLDGWVAGVLTLLVAGAVQIGTFLLVARRMRIEELNALLGMVRSRLGR
ncbi:murein biosynthesis integral membrane protein MurJ [Streptomyces sp. NRRL B-24484]|uniref:murein biosynthesis integral membrane protein MurJ n=1 Tax=Streptomyces sp. NRRL B-24484 TaxID=1463833 RepID=UPI0004C20E62|nr:murein biosynthesis integral membrane protein MurJ [Streptomyces sp. NRRL B-24484]